MTSNGKTQIFPRVLLQNWRPSDLRDVQNLAGHLNDIAEEHGFDGFVIEMQWQGFIYHAKYDDLERVEEALIDLSDISDNPLILVVPPLGGQGRTTHTEHGIPMEYIEYFPHRVLVKLKDSFLAFQIMTYDYVDYSKVDNPDGRPNAPLAWVRYTIEKMTNNDAELKQKIIMGINFYGRYYDELMHGDNSVTGKSFIEKMEQTKGPMQMTWVKKFSEHKIKFEEGNTVYYYPSVKSVQARLRLADELGVAGVAIWEIGQGLSNFPVAFTERFMEGNVQVDDIDRYLDEL